jgi:hypothetical protein
MKEDGPKPKHCVVVLSDERGVIGHLCVRRLDRPPPWLTVWRHRQELHGPLAAWMRTLDKEPSERILVGSVGLSGPTARAVVALVAGWFGRVSQASNIGRRGRPTGRIEPDGSLKCWPSRAAAARDLGVSRWAVRRRVRAGKMLDVG